MLTLSKVECQAGTRDLRKDLRGDPLQEPCRTLPRGRAVVAQFLTEATVLSVLGGLLGVAAGLGLAYALPHLTEQRTIVSYPAAALALAISAVVGIAAGLGPANQAAALDPAEAPRYE